jgi:nucleotide-binding universal stress UspA family protein
MKTILYATDCSKNDASTLKYAYRFSYIMKADLHILHVYKSPLVNISLTQSTEVANKRIKQEQKDDVNKFCQTHLKNEFRQTPITIHVEENASIEDAIADTTETLKPDLVILGTKDDYSKRGFFSNNIANELLDKIETPLMMIPNGLIYTNISTIIYATDFENEDVELIKQLTDIVRPFDALIEVVHIYRTDTTTAKEKMERFKTLISKQISYKDITFKTIASTKIKSGLLSVIDNEQANMIAMLERKHELSIHNLLRKDLVKEMEANVAIPLIAFNKKSSSQEKELFSVF